MGTGGRPTREDDGHAWALPSSVPVGSPISRSEIGRQTRGVGILECGDLVLGQCDVERGDGIGEMAVPGGADPGCGHDRGPQNPRKCNLGHRDTPLAFTGHADERTQETDLSEPTPSVSVLEL
jgi:hypothetical protein